MNIEQHGARGIADVGDVALALAQLPGQPGIDGAKSELTALGLLSCARYVIKYPFQLGRREIRIENQAVFFLDDAGMTLLALLRARGFGAPVLPDDGVEDRLAGLAVPDYRGFTLVGDAQGGNVAWCNAGFLHDLGSGRQLAAPDFHRVVFYPTGLRKDLPELLLCRADDISRMIKDDAARAGGALIEGE